MAEQTTPVQRKVALKIIKAGMDTRQVNARFEAERQALALMDHPNIAKVFDGGMTDAGRPYFVMELVKGVPVTQYCDEHRLTPPQRLRLFIQVCQAVQHAHQKGIIHRDIKPSNVLIALYDGEPVPKVIDFGVAKATGQQLTESTMFTGFGDVIGTPQYMSPEQAEMNQLDIDTRSDIYSLGVLLYELLTGTTPLDAKRVKEAALLEVLRVIREEEAPRPSTRLTATAELASIAAQRGLEPRSLSGIVRGELDWIVMKALEKDRSRRYETANGFAMDVQRYLAGEPVLAGPASATYRLRKFGRRHRRVLTAVALFILLLVSAVVALTFALVAVNQERKGKEAALEAEAKRRKQTRGALDTMSSQLIEEWLAKQEVLLPQHKKFLEQALHDYEEFAADVGQGEESRAAVANAHTHVAYIRAVLGERKEAEAASERARDLYAGLVADFPGVPFYRSELAGAHLNIAIMRSDADRAQQAQADFDQALRIGRALVWEFPDVPSYRLSLAKHLNQCGIHFKNTGRPQEAEEAYKEALAHLKQLAADHPTERGYREALGGTLGDLGVLLDRPGRSKEAVLKDPGRSREAADAFTQAVAIFQQLATENPANSDYRERLAMHQDHLAGTLHDAGRYPEAEEGFLQALKTRRQLVIEFPGKPAYREGLAVTLNNYGILLKNTDRALEAEKYYGDSLTIHKQLAADHPDVVVYQDRVAAASLNLARLILARKDPQAALRLLQDAEPYLQAALKAYPQNPRYRNDYRLIRWRLAETLLELKDHEAASSAASEFLQADVEPPRDAYTAACLFAGCVRLAAQDERLSADKRQELATMYEDRAMSALRQAIDKGAKEVSQIPKDSSLDPLRSRRDFQKLLSELEEKSKPSDQ
jgi:serine/threonine protein kinase